jgi:acetyltransferase
MSAEPSQEALIAAWTSAVETHDGSKLLIRPLESRDREREVDFIDRLSPATRYYRLLTPLKFLPPHLLDQLMDVDYRSRMAFVATCDASGTERFVGLARYGETDRADTVELGITVADAWQHRGVARVLMPVLLEYARMRGFSTAMGFVLAENYRMLALARALGFTIAYNPQEHLMQITRSLS